MVNQLWYKSLGLASWLTIFLVLPFNQYRVLAQLTPDTTLGAESSRVTPNVEVRGGPADLIEGGAGRGANLFHSFAQFNVQELQRVYFANPVGIENILTRITGADPSNIFGTLGVDGAANLYLLNPHGILFGANAQLDVEGSFVGSTANALTFEDGSSYSAANPGDSSVLTIRVPLGLQYGTNQTGAITNRGNLSAGQDLTLSAGNLDLQGQLLAGKDLTLEAQDTVQIRDSATVPFIAAAGEQLLVQGKEAVDIFALNHPDSGLFSGGDMVLRSASPVLGDAHYWSGGSFRIEQLDGSLGGLESPNDPVIRTVGDVFIGGYIGASLHIIAGGKVEIPNFIVITGEDPVNGLQETVTLADGTTISIDGRNEPTLDIRGGVEPAESGTPFFSGTGNDLFIIPLNFPITPTSADITIGDILVLGKGKVFLTNQYQPNLLLDTPNGINIGSIDARNFLGGSSVVINSRSNITLNGTVDASAFDFSGTFLGNGGDVKLIAEGGITLNQESNILSLGLLGGNITFNSKGDISIAESLIRSSSFTDVAGATGGEISVTANSLSLTDGAALSTLTFGAGDAGAVKITATDSLRLDGESSAGIPSAIVSQVDLGAEGNSGGIELTTASLELTNGAFLSASTFGVGDAGAVKITATDSLRLDGESSNGSSSGVFTVVAPEAEGNSGEIELTTASLELTNGAQVSASTLGIGDAGAVKITATDSLRLDGEGRDGLSNISSEVELGAEGNSGGIELTTAFLELTNGAGVSASTLGIGNAGAVKITATDSLRLDGESSNGSSSAIFSQVGSGAEGDSEGIELTTATLELTNGAFLSASTLGVGDAGAVKIKVTDSLQLDGENRDGIPSHISSQVEQGAQGNSGGIELTTASLEATNGAVVSASTFGVGNAGAVKITATDSVLLDGETSTNIPSTISSQVTSGAQGNSGGIELTTGSLEVTNGAQVDSSTLGVGDAGALRITATDSVLLDGESRDGSSSSISSQVSSGAEGNSEGIELTTATLEVTNGAEVDASTFGVGDAGAVKITATDSVLLDGESNSGNTSAIFSQVAPEAKGNSGGIELTTATLEVTNGAGVDSSTFGVGDAGKVQISATDSVRLDGESRDGVSSGISSEVELGAEGNSGGIELTTATLEVTNGAQVNASTGGVGNAGAVKITTTDSLRLDGESSNGFSSSVLSQVDFGAEGNSEGIELTTATLEVTNGAGVDTSTGGIGNAGKVQITATDSVRLDGESRNGIPSAISSQVTLGAEGNSEGIELTTAFLELTNGAVVNSSTFGVGNAGTVNIIATDSIRLDGEDSDGFPSGVFSQVVSGAKGNSRGIELTTVTLEVTNGAGVSSSTFGMGDAGALKITATDSIRLDGESSTGKSSAISSEVEQGAQGSSGGIELTTVTLEVTNSAVVTASTGGVGNAGVLKINATDSVHLDGESRDGIPSAILSEVAPGAEGNSEGIELITAFLELNNGAQVSASTGGIGNAGLVKINATDSVHLDGESRDGFLSGVFSQVASGAEGNSEGIELTTSSLEVTNGAFLSASTFGVGDSGAVKITATDSVQLDGESRDGFSSAISSGVGSQAEGNSRGIELTTAILELTNGAEVSASTLGIGNAGLVKITTIDSVRLDGESRDGFLSGVFSVVAPGAEGNSQGIDLTTASLELTNGAQVNASTGGVGDAGLVKITATDSVRLDGESRDGFSSSISSAVDSGARGNSRGIELTTSSLKLTNGAQVNTSTFGMGDAGAVRITATDSVRLDGESSNGFSSGVFSAVDSGAEGDSGRIELTTSSLELTNGAQVNASTFGMGDAGTVGITATDSVRLNGESSDGTPSGIFSTVESGAEGNSKEIDLTTSSLELTNGAQVNASTFGEGSAGNIFVRNAQSVFLDNNSSISTSVEPNSSGVGGDINIQTNSLTLEDNSQISARSQGIKRAGNINLNVSESLTATDSDITTSSTQSAGGAINIIAKDIRLRGDSDITTSVFSGADNGGDITITTDSLIAFADSDILAFARDGRGGDITFLTPIFFGFAFRPAPKGTDPATLDLNNRVDINASGAVDGVITLPNLDFITNSLTELQDNLIDTDSILANSCIVRTKPQEATFTITGGGNLPLRPGDSSSSPYPTGVVRAIPRDSPPRPWQKGDPIHQATGVYQLPDGRLVIARECG
ncbi:MAG: filamentous hemagglutinin N-terminal domain-containing protein [Symploca sp. SIO1C2]|nr:filamentous hemagglutinin N-terminal domain-containing protein [Symploca sp. SIO1C2]